MDLTALTRLPGAPHRNFEALTRAIVSRRYGALGTLRERRQQPGVEFYLQVEHGGDLGDSDRVWGWSCKWFIVGGNNELTQGQREQIEDSLAMAIKHVEGLTDFVLCLPTRPAKKDEEWISNLGRAKGISTKLWAAENFEAELSGHDELRATFFGELVLSPDVLARVHERSVAPVNARWMPQLHTSNHVERWLERALLRPGSFDWLDHRIEAIAARNGALREGMIDIEDDDLRAGAEVVADDINRFVADLRAIAAAVQDLRPLEARDRIADQQPPSTSPRTLRSLVLQLRKRRLPAALAVTGLAAEIRDVVSWLDEAYADMRAPLFAVVAAAGLGKTHLAAQLTAPKDRPTAGIFIDGGRLHADGNLDDLARRIPGLKVKRFDDLLEALNSAGARCGTRIPLVIDGLNEAERPSEWHGLLAELTPALDAYPNVLVVITLREALAERALPDKAAVVDLEWQRSEVNDMVGAYFDHYLIDATGAWLPVGMFHNPLFVRMYCEAANSVRQVSVGVEKLPTSLIGVFELYRDGVIERLAHDPARLPVAHDEIRRRLAAVAREMWDRGVRRLPSDAAKAILDAGGMNWDDSLFRRLEEEGVLSRYEVDGSEDTQSGFLFDRLAGYLVADALLGRIAYVDVEERLAEAALWKSLHGEEAHPLGQDAAIGLIGLVPRRFSGHHLWRHASDKHRLWTLLQELDTESEFLDNGTVDELRKLVATWGSPGHARYGNRHPFDRLWEVRTSPTHRLNADFLDGVLRSLSLPQRDRRWTEWVRSRRSEALVDDLKVAIAAWTEDVNRSAVDDLNAVSMAWLLTSTSSEVRDLATKALQRYGRVAPGRLFDVAARMLDVDDPYVVERVVGAAFGAASAQQMPDPGGPFERALATWLIELRDRFLDGGTSPTSHELLRSYIQATFELAAVLHPGAVPVDVTPFALAFPGMAPAPIMPDDDPNAEECDSTFGMDFENYVIGSAIEGRDNYDFAHAAFRRARGEVMARIWDLGWRADLLGDVDRDIARSDRQHGDARPQVERYGKKYGWIAYHELVGRLADAGQHASWFVGGGRTITPDIDPSFPDEPPAVLIPLPEWVPTASENDEEWLRTGEVRVPSELWSPDNIHGVAGGWLLVEGFLKLRKSGHQVFGFFHTLLLKPPDLEPALAMINERKYLGNRFFPRPPTVGGVFAGETPWSPRFIVRFDDEDADAHRHPALRHDWRDKGIGLTQVAIELSTNEIGPPTALKQSYDVPSFEFAARFGLRQLPGSLDLVGFDGVRASATFRTDGPWRGQLLFIRRDLVEDFANQQRIVQVGWGERQISVEWGSVPTWMREAYQSYEHVWRDIRVLDEPH